MQAQNRGALRNLFSRKPRVRIGRVMPTRVAVNGGQTYEIIPESYGGPWELKPGTVLQIVSVPKGES